MTTVWIQTSRQNLNVLKPYKRQKNKKLALRLGIQTYEILTNDDEVCVPSLSSILLALIIVGFYFPPNQYTVLWS